MATDKRKLGRWMALGILISTLSIAALVLHLSAFREIKFDGPALILLFLALLPWLSAFLDNATLPGGWRIEFRKLKEQQDKQEADIDDITNFLFDNFLTGNELTQLQKLNAPDRFSYKFQGGFEKELRNLLELKLIDRHLGRGVRSARKDQSPDNDLRKHFFVTDKGEWYLVRRAKRKADEENQ